MYLQETVVTHEQLLPTSPRWIMLAEVQWKKVGFVSLDLTGRQELGNA